MYVIFPDSYSFWAIIIVRETENPSLRLASCCSVEVVNGGEGFRLDGLVSKLSIVKTAFSQAFKKSSASAAVSNLFGSSALSSSFGFPVEKTAVTLKAAVGVKWLISRSRSTISLTATDCTRPADKDGFTLRHNTGESSKPTSRSSTRRACWALTRL